MATLKKHGAEFKIGDAIIRENPLTGDFLVSGQKGTETAYACRTLPDARAMAKTINNFNKTGEIKAF